MKICGQDETVETVDAYYDVSETAIKDHSMLGAHGQELCNNLEVHWMTPTCETRKCLRIPLSDW